MAILPVISVLSVLAFSSTTLLRQTTLSTATKHLSDVAISNPGIQSIQSHHANINLPSSLSLKRLISLKGHIYSPGALYVSSNISTYKGDIFIGDHSAVMGSISTFSGKVSLNGVTVAGDIKSLHGNISINGKTVIYGDVIVGHLGDVRHVNSPSHTEHQPQNVHIGSDVRIFGRLIIQQSVLLCIDNLASVQGKLLRPQ